jgi:predicted short-subunit dehydrogenase-like oxidoreductase (DUF2520 family)
VRAEGRLGVGVLGAGRVGPVLGAALAGAGHAVVGITAVSQESRDRADAMLPAVPVLSIPDLIERSELVLVAVPDEELPGLIGGLAEAGIWLPGQLVVHTSPRYGTDVLLPAVRRGAIPVALAPAMAFTGTSVDLLRLREARCAVTAPSPVLPIGMALAVELGCEPVILAEEDREAWATALADAVEPLERAMRTAAARLARLGVQEPGAVLGPVARSALDRALERAGRARGEEEDR